MSKPVASTLGALLGAFVFFTSASAHAQTNEYRALWVDGFGAGYRTADQVTTLMSNLRAMNMNAVVPEVRKATGVYYLGSPYDPRASDVDPGFDALADMIAKGHDTSDGKQRIEIHAWIVTYKTSGASPAWAHKNYNGSISTGEFDPGHPQVQERIYNVAMDIISRYDVDGFNFDYIRYPETTAGNASPWGYNDVTVARFNAKYGRTGLPATNDLLWAQFRRDQVTALVRKVYLNTMAIKPWVKISADTVTWSPGPIDDASWTNARPYNDALQDWRSWMEEGILDLNMTMSYFRVHVPDQDGDFYEWAAYAKNRKFNRQLIIGPALYLNQLSNSITQLRSIREPTSTGNRADGLSGYDYGQISVDFLPLGELTNALTRPSVYDPISPPLYAERATIPDMPWKSAPTKGHLKGFIAGGVATNRLDGAAISISGTVNRAFISDATGFFGSVDLPPGDYELTGSFPGFGSVTTNFSVTAGLVTTRDLVLPGPPIITQSPQSLSAAEGTNMTLTVSVSGEGPLTYQWKFNGGNLSETTSSLSLTNVTTNHAGNYWVVVSNSAGSATSQVATLTIIPPPRLSGTTLLWQASTNNRPYFSTTHLERGLAYNPASGNLLLISRNGGTNIYVLDGNTGSDLHRLTLMSNVTGGTFALLMLGVADDGVVYAGNLSLPGSGPYRLYRWANDSTSSIPEVAFSDDPGLGNSQRWGDTMDVRGSGTNTQIILGSRLSTIVSILTTTNGTNFTSRVVNIAGVPNSSFGLGISFGQSNTFWGKSTNAPLRQVAFDLGAGTGTVIRTIGEPAIPNTLIPIGVSAALNLFAGIAIEAPDHLKLYDLSMPGTPSLIGTNHFAMDLENVFFTGSVDFGPDRVYALDSNNGITAMKLNFVPGVPPLIQATAMMPDQRLKLWMLPEQRPYVVEASSNLVHWTALGTRVPDAGHFEIMDPHMGTTSRFYRLRAP